MATTSITIRMEEDLKRQAENLFDEIGMNMTTAFTIFAKTAVRQQKIPFELAAGSFNRESNQAGLRQAVKDIDTEFGMGISSTDITRAFSIAVLDKISENQSKGYPVARYDAVSKRAYLECADGTREYVNG